MGPLVLLHLGGAGTFTAAFIVALIFVGIFTLSFAFGRPPGGGRRFSRVWAQSWLKASLPRLAVAAAFSGLFFLASAQFGSGGEQEAPNLCDRPLPPLSPGPIGKQDFDMARAGMEGVIGIANQGDIASARNAFFLRVHDFTHNVDGPLRAKDDGLAKELCRAVAQIEVEFLSPTPREAATIAEHAQGIRELLRQAAAVLGFE